MNESQTKPTEDEAFLCRALIGLYVFVFAVGALFHLIIGYTLRGLFQTSWRILKTFYTSQQFPTLTGYEILSCGALALLSGGVFLFPHYCLRLRSRPMLVSRRALWLLTAAHSFGIMFWLCYAAWLDRREFAADHVPILFAICAVPFLLFVSSFIPLLSRHERSA